MTEDYIEVMDEEKEEADVDLSRRPIEKLKGSDLENRGDAQRGEQNPHVPFLWTLFQRQPGGHSRPPHPLREAGREAVLAS